MSQLDVLQVRRKTIDCQSFVLDKYLTNSSGDRYAKSVGILPRFLGSYHFGAVSLFVMLHVAVVAAFFVPFTPSLLVRMAVRNLAPLERQNRLLSAASRGFDTLRHRLRGNSIAGSRRNIQAHYDLSNDFFRLFLDRSLMYSCARFESEEDSLEAAQFHKLDTICRKLRLGPQDHVLEIGTGWGGFAEHAVKHYGCRVTTTTISRRQYEYARQRFQSIPQGERIELLQEDYRNLRGRYHKIVSIEMFEAVGLSYYDAFFRTCDRLLRPDGAMLMQTITIHEQAFPAYHRSSDWIQKYIFPGSELASVSEILRSLARATSLGLYHAEDIGTHYARTLAVWRKRFQDAVNEVRELGFDGRFIRMWDYYLAYCEGAFLERHVGDFQLLLTKNHNPKTLFQEPWRKDRVELELGRGAVR